MIDTITVRDYDRIKDYPHYVAWVCHKHGDPSMPDRLPDTGCTALDENGKPIAMGFAYPTEGNCGVVFFHNFVARPFNTVAQTRTAMYHISSSLEMKMEELGYNYIYGSSHDPTFTREAENLGYIVGALPLYELMKEI